MMPLLQLEELSPEDRRRTFLAAQRISEETGISSEEAMERALSETGREPAQRKVQPFRRSGLRWDE